MSNDPVLSVFAFAVAQNLVGDKKITVTSKKVSNMRYYERFLDVDIERESTDLQRLHDATIEVVKELMKEVESNYPDAQELMLLGEMGIGREGGIGVFTQEISPYRMRVIAGGTFGTTENDESMR
ncbi:MAG: hypothetical protein ABSB40_14245 [Nitrososphaeria archaeon]|jgi:hypothetical protein